VLVLESEGGKQVTPSSEASLFCLTKDKSGQNFTFTWLRQLEGSTLPPEVYKKISYHQRQTRGINPFLFIKNIKINGYLYQQRVSPPLKKRPDMLSEVNAAHPGECDSPLQIVMTVWHPFCLNPNFLGRV
jgi:hypothetical protein